MITFLELKNQAEFMPDYPNDILVQYPVSSFEYPPPKSPYIMAPTCLWYHFKKEDLPFITHTHVIRSDGSIKDYSRINPTEDMQWLNIDNAYCSNIGPHIGAVYLDPDNKKQLVLLIKRSFPIKEKTTRKETMFIWWNIPLRIIGKENLFEGWIRNYFQLSSPKTIQAAMEMVKSYVATRRYTKLLK